MAPGALLLKEAYLSSAGGFSPSSFNAENIVWRSIRMSYNIAIPSYNRAEVLQDKTLQMLKGYNIPANRITIFVANQEEKKKYMEVCDKSLYGKMVVGQKGVMAIRNFITRYYPKDAYVISLDDDIDGFDKCSTGDKPKWSPIKSFKDEMIEEGMKLMKANNYHIWGIYPNRNAGYASKMKPVSTDLKFLIGHCFGFINKKVMTHIDYKEDYERSLEYALMDGGVIRFNHICAKTRFGLPGGVGKTSKERVSTYHKEVEFLIKKYPSLVRKNSRREGEVLLARTVKSASKGGSSRVAETANDYTGGAGQQNAPKNVISDDDKADESIKRLLIRNKAKYVKARENLLEALSKIAVPKIPKGRKESGRMNAPTNRGDVLGTDGRTLTMGFGDNRHGWNFFKMNEKFPDVYKALIEFGNQVVPKGWEYQTITLNHNAKAKKHTDKKNVGKSVIIGIGNYTGGELRVYSKDSSKHKDYDIHDKPAMFNGGVLPHETQTFAGEGTHGPYKKGLGRYTMIFYRQGRKPENGVKVGIGAGKDSGIAQPTNPPIA